MFTHNFDPVIFSLGPIQARWYGLMYVIGFILGSRMLLKLARERTLKLMPEKVDVYVLYLIVGMFICARSFYMLVYGLEDLLTNPLEIFAVWHGGLSFHGGLIGFVLATYIYSRREKIAFWNLGDAAALCAAQGFFWGRLGNFINGELYGRTTDLPWGIVFPMGGPYPRHPSQLYEAIGEGIILTMVLWFLKGRVKRDGILISVFLIGYGIIRFIVEFFREADMQMGYYFGEFLTMGQILCFLMIIAGVSLLYFLRKAPSDRG
ncbi:MAG: prolipoprotein diacylglyceryl transferase [Oligoflexia bacterium]|nr:prolipoprotein diacylglyceryl transferase [Oligoflexia bacterium]MBF0366316.1 prolipoprotein diacylglyceryl transferase [Oligoflexia bacterium]